MNETTLSSPCGCEVTRLLTEPTLGKGLRGDNKTPVRDVVVRKCQTCGTYEYRRNALIDEASLIALDKYGVPSKTNHEWTRFFFETMDRLMEARHGKADTQAA